MVGAVRGALQGQDWKGSLEEGFRHPERTSWWTPALGESQEYSNTNFGTGSRVLCNRLLPQDEVIFGHKICEASGQAVWEALALLIALRLWEKFMRDRKVRLRVHSGSTAAL